MTLTDLIDRLTALRAVHGGEMGVSVTDGDESYELTPEMVDVFVAAVSSELVIDLTV